MGKCFFINKVVAITCVVAAIGAVATIIALFEVYTQEKSPAPWQSYRLPDSLSPVSYNVTLWPHLEPNADKLYIFIGHSSVVFTCVKETDLILIHSNELKLILFDGFHAKLKGLDGATAPSLKKTWLEVPTQYLVVQLSSPLQAGSMYELFTKFVGELTDNLGGFYRSEYIEDGKKRCVFLTLALLLFIVIT